MNNHNRNGIINSNPASNTNRSITTTSNSSTKASLQGFDIRILIFNGFNIY